ncbi:MAG: tRNA dimethylallyltransferase, partial [Chitinophagaceae bacterium]
RVERNFGIKKFGLQLGKEELHANIDFRVDQMFEEGIVQEVRELLEYRQLKALQTVGYQELFEYFDGKISLDTAKQLIKKNTRQYAKRQMTWFMRDPAITWVDAHMDPVEFAKSILME